MVRDFYAPHVQHEIVLHLVEKLERCIGDDSQGVEVDRSVKVTITPALADVGPDEVEVLKEAVDHHVAVKILGLFIIPKSKVGEVDLDTTCRPSCVSLWPADSGPRRVEPCQDSLQDSNDVLMGRVPEALLLVVQACIPAEKLGAPLAQPNHVARYVDGRRRNVLGRDVLDKPRLLRRDGIG